MTTKDLGGLKIGEYRAGEFEDVVKVFQESYSRTYPHFDKRLLRTERFRDILENHVIPNSSVRTAKCGEKVVGFLALSENFIDQLYVLEEFRNRGLGSFWIGEAKRIFPDHLELYTFECNERAIAFYQRHGFDIIERGIAPDEKLPDVKMRWEG